MTVQAQLTLRHAAGRVGEDRIALLRAIADHGSITAAAKAVGLSYKGAWDAVQVMNNLFERPLVLPSAGGAAGGASVVTAAGQAVIAAFDAVAADLAATIARLEDNLVGSVLRPLLMGTAMKTSARNALRGEVLRVTQGEVEAEVVLAIADGVEIVATITRASVDALGLAPGVVATALVKASFVVLARGEPGMRTSARNCLAGRVVARHDGAVGSEVTLELHVGKTLTATLTRASADALDLVVGAPALALVKASHVILAVD
ncbi:MAG TPA: TOBE domain-containing protein [Sphingomonas sp.]|jgi:molybdate transport system regulatory protein|nr:TOBE domain-containing protein [Sphingomonas sp.]